MKTYIIAVISFIFGMITNVSIGINKYHDGYSQGMEEGKRLADAEARTEGYHAAMENMRFCFPKE